MNQQSPKKKRLIAASTNLTVSTLIAAALGLSMFSLGTLTDDPAPSEAVQANETAETAAEMPTTQAPPTGVNFGSAEISQRAHETMGYLSYPWQAVLPDWTITFVEGKGSVAGYTWSHEKRIEIFVRENSTPEFLYRVLAHELGHAVDVAHNDGDERREWLAARDAEGTDWWPGSGKADFQTGAGDFAESFAVWITGDATDFRSELGPAPSDEQIELLVKLVPSQP